MPDQVVGLALELASAIRERDDAAKQANEFQREIARLRKVEQLAAKAEEQLGDNLAHGVAAEANARQWQTVAAARERELATVRKERDDAVTRVEQFKEQVAALKVELTEGRDGATFSSAVAESQRKRAEDALKQLAEMQPLFTKQTNLRVALREFLGE